MRFEPEEVERVARQAQAGEGAAAMRRPWIDREIGEAESDTEEEAVDDARRQQFEERVRRAAAELARKELARRDLEQAEQKRVEQQRQAAETRAAYAEIASLLAACTERDLATLADDPEFMRIVDELLSGAES
jgi:hypothetical protein